MIVLSAFKYTVFANKHNSLGDKLIVANSVSLEAIDEDSYDGFIYVVSKDASENQIQKMEKEINKSSAINEIWDNSIYRADSIEDIQNVANPSIIEFIEPNYHIRLNEIANFNDTYFNDNKWIYSTVKIQNVWSWGIKGSGQNNNKTPTIAVLDSGVAGWNKTQNRHEDLDYSMMPYALSGYSIRSVDDKCGHGTFVIGEIAAVMNNNLGVTGLMPEVKIVPASVLDSEGEGEISDMISVIGKLSSRGDVDVINMSFGSYDYSAAMQRACNEAAKEGIILVASAGNDGDTRMGSFYNYPASYDNVISVASIDSTGWASLYSQHNNRVDAAAPGEGIIGLGAYNENDEYIPSKTNGYTEMSGTSMAAPVVSALAAMTKSFEPDINHNDFLAILQKTSNDVGIPGYDNYYGWGIVDFEKVYYELQNRAEAIKKYNESVGIAKSLTAKIKSINVKKGNKAIVKWIDTNGSKNYQIRYGTRKNMKGAKTQKVINKKSIALKNLKPKKKYFIQVRPITKVKNEVTGKSVNIAGTWSITRTFKTKRN